MQRLKLLCMLIISGTLLFSCSETGTNPNDPDDPGNGDDPIEPTASVDNPSDGDNLEGEITLVVDGEAENGFDELRVYVGEELVETISDPTLPYEQAIKTYEYDNGDHDFNAELDVSEADTTISASISVTLENYMVELETDNFIAALNEDFDAVYMFISDPDGNVLNATELSAQNDGVIKLLPPEELDNGAPEWYDITIARKTTDYQNRDALYLNTDTQLKPWTRLYKSGITPKDPGPKRELTVEINNFDQLDQVPMYTMFQSTEYIDQRNIFYWDYYFSHTDPATLSATFEVSESSEDLVITHTPDPSSGTNPTPLYLWEDDLTGLPNSVSYDVTQDFTPMVAHSVGIPSGVDLSAYAYFMTGAPNSFDKGDVDFAYWPVSSVNDANSSNSGFDMWVPEITERSFITYFDGYDKNNSNIRYRYQSAIGDFPSQFKTNSGAYEIGNATMDNVSPSYSGSGSADYGRVVAESSSSSHYHSWSVQFGSEDSFVFPKIADSLDSSVSNYDRSSFEFSSIWTTSSDKIDGYDEYLDSEYGTTDYGELVDFVQTIITLPAASQKPVSRKKKMESKAIPDRSINLDRTFMPHKK